jgi:hypothetical protein
LGLKQAKRVAVGAEDRIKEEAALAEAQLRKSVENKGSRQLQSI